MYCPKIDIKKRLANKIFVYEKSKKNILKIKKLKLPVTIIKKPEDAVAKSKLIIKWYIFDSLDPRIEANNKGKDNSNKESLLFESK